MNRRAFLLAPLLVLLAACGTSASDEAVADSKPLTVENNADLAALLAGPSTGPTVNAFSEQYRTQTVEFDAVVTDAYINPREYNGESWIRVMAGSEGDPQRTGPLFQLSWIGQDSPLKQYAVGTNVRVSALVGMVYGFEPFQFFLVPDEGSSAFTPR